MEEYQSALIAAAVAVMVFISVYLCIIRNRRRRAKKVDQDLRPVSTIQGAYYAPAQLGQYPINQNQNLYGNSPAPGWYLANLDQQTNGVNIRQSPAGAYIIPREPVVFSQNGYPVHEPRAAQEQPYGRPPPYNVGLT